MAERISRYLVRGGLLGIALLLISCVTEPPTTALNQAQGSYPDARVGSTIGGLGPGDVISISFAGAPDMNLRQRIRGDGKVSLPMVGDVVAGGKSLSAFQRELERLYKSRLQDPSVVVTRDATAAVVYVSGGVNNPTKIPLDRPITVMEAVMEAGGFSPAGNPKHVVVLRTVKGKRQRFVLDMRTAMDNSATQPFYLKPFDVIVVSERNW